MLGNASYALYLVHLTVIPLAICALARFGFLAAMPAAVTVAVLTLLCLCAAIALHKAVEVPLAISFAGAPRELAADRSGCRPPIPPVERQSEYPPSV